MSFFAGAHHFNVDRLHINTGGPSGSYRDVLEEHICAGAIHDSAERSDAPKCHPETRTAVQDDILSWITHGDEDEQPSRILWLTGPAGAGKTAIAGSIAEICEEWGLLAATFFFSFAGSADRGSKRCLVTTLAHQMAQIDGCTPLGDRILAAVERGGRALFNKRLQSQLDSLILRPLREVTTKTPKFFASPWVIIIDGLDEVSADKGEELPSNHARHANEADQVEILSILLHAARSSSFPFRIIIASRPERVIRDFFSRKASDIHRQLFLDDKYSPNDDIRLLLESSFASIRRRYGLPSSWPGRATISTLVDRSSGQFVYAATVVRFLNSATSPPTVRLQHVMDVEERSTQGNPFAALDALYSQILHSSPEPIVAIQRIAVYENDPLSRVHDGTIFAHPGGWVPFATRLFEDFPGHTVHVFENLASLIWVPAPGEESKPYKLQHKSLIDFLSDPARCGKDFYDAYSIAQSEGFIMKRLHQVFEARSTVVPLWESERAVFMATLLDLLIARSWAPLLASYRQVDGSYKPEMWHAIVTVLHFIAISNVRYKSLRLVDKLWEGIHDACPLGYRQPYRACLQACKFWRSRIHRACMAYGWRSPDVLDLVKLKLCPQVLSGDAVPRIGLWHNGFEFPNRSDLPPVSGLEVECPASGGDCDSEYQVLIKSADDILVRLWEQYSAEDSYLVIRSSSALNVRLSIESLCRGAGITPTGQLLEEADGIQ